jgi:hypothetical protein
MLVPTPCGWRLHHLRVIYHETGLWHLQLRHGALEMVACRQVLELGLSGLACQPPTHSTCVLLTSLLYGLPATSDHCCWVGFDMPKKWSPVRADSIDLGSNRFCIVKSFYGTNPPIILGFSQDKDDGLL